MGQGLLRSIGGCITVYLRNILLVDGESEALFFFSSKGFIRDGST